MSLFLDSTIDVQSVDISRPFSSWEVSACGDSTADDVTRVNVTSFLPVFLLDYTIKDSDKSEG